MRLCRPLARLAIDTIVAGDNVVMDMPQLSEIKNGDEVKGTFPAEEMAARLAGVRAHLAEAGIDFVLFTSYHNICYYSDFLYCRFGRDYALVVTQDRLTSVSANIDGGQPWRRGFGGDNQYYWCNCLLEFCDS